jgi:tetratricopeptide (TPR) repeat protein
VAALAYHFAQAGNEPVKAAKYSELAAEQAEQRFAYHEATQLWEQAIACFDRGEGGDPKDRLELVLNLVRALAQVGQLERARSYRRDAVSAAVPLDDPVLLGRVIVSFDVPRMWPSHDHGVTDDELVGVVEQTLERLPYGDEPLRCRLLTTLGFELLGAESDRGYRASAEAVEMARRLGDAGALAIAINARYFQSFRHDGLGERRRLGTELLELPGKPVTAEALAHMLLLGACTGAADFAAADWHADQAERIAARYGLDVTAAAVSFYRAMRTALGGDPAAANQLYAQTARALRRHGLWQHGIGMSVFGRFTLLAMQDRVAEIADELEPLLMADVICEPYALALAASGHVTEARVAAGRPRPIRPDILWLLLTGVRGLLGIAIDDRDRAERAYQALLPYAARPTGADSGVFTLWPAAQILGDLARYLALPGAEEHYRLALAIGERAGVAVWREAALRGLSACLGPAEPVPPGP